VDKKRAQLLSTKLSTINRQTKYCYIAVTEKKQKLYPGCGKINHSKKYLGKTCLHSCG